MTEERRKLTPKEAKVLAEIEKSYGKGTLTILGWEGTRGDVAVWPTGTKLDETLGCGGIPRGRIIEISGPESGGKTTMSLHFATLVQKSGGNVAFIDAEHALSKPWVKDLGVDLNRFWFTQPDCGEDALEIAEQMIEIAELVIVDSVAALTPKKELEGEIGDWQSNVGLQARMMSQALRRLVGKVSQANSTIIFINQVRETIDFSGFGPNETTPGGRALKFYSSVRLRVSPLEQITVGSKVVGKGVKVKAIKNKVGPPLEECQLAINWVNGTVTDYSSKKTSATSLFDEAIESGVLIRDRDGYHFQDLNWGRKPEVVTALEGVRLAERFKDAIKIADELASPGPASPDEPEPEKPA